uniref:Uncharacterized protein n=1 Tax=Arundo donax TaxID=35708 RepID=A0A0A9BNC0_ARUDO
MFPFCGSCWLFNLFGADNLILQSDLQTQNFSGRSFRTDT